MSPIVNIPVCPGLVQNSLRISTENFTLACKIRAFRKTGSNFEDPSLPACFHSLSDVIEFISFLSYGWPKVTTSCLGSVAELLADEISFSLEKSLDFLPYMQQPLPESVADCLLTNFKYSLREEFGFVKAAFYMRGVDWTKLDELLDGLEHIAESAFSQHIAPRITDRDLPRGVSLAVI